MPRPPRIQFANAVYHVTSRGNGRRCIFFSTRDRERFLEQLRDNAGLYGVQVLAFVLMDNHYHLLVRTPKANLARFMQRLNTSYALYARFKHRRPGHLLQGRYHARLVQEDGYLLAVTRYIHLNPVKTGPAVRLSAADRIMLLASFPWSSLGAYRHGRDMRLSLDFRALESYGGTGPAARKRYWNYVKACISDDDEVLREALSADSYAVGAEDFQKGVIETLRTRKTGKATDRDLALPASPTMALNRIDEAVGLACHLDPAQLKSHGLHVGIAKALAIELAARHSGLRLRAIGAHYGLKGSSGISMLRRRLQQRLQHEPDLIHLLAKIESVLMQSEK